MVDTHVQSGGCQYYRCKITQTCDLIIFEFRSYAHLRFIHGLTRFDFWLYTSHTFLLQQVKKKFRSIACQYTAYGLISNVVRTNSFENCTPISAVGQFFYTQYNKFVLSFSCYSPSFHGRTDVIIIWNYRTTKMRKNRIRVDEENSVEKTYWLTKNCFRRVEVALRISEFFSKTLMLWN